jgi:hypothetical protein
MHIRPNYKKLNVKEKMSKVVKEAERGQSKEADLGMTNKR